MTKNALLWIAMGGMTVGYFLSLTGCNGSPTNPQPPAQEVQQKVTLTNFDSCPALEQYIEDNYVKQMQLQIDQEISGQYGGYYGGPFGGLEDGAATPTTASSGSGSTQSAPTAYTTTNLQVKGVDEADFMKNDGTRIFTIAGNTLYGAHSWPPQDLKSAAHLEIEGWPQSMFLDENNRVTVFSSAWLTTDGSLPKDANGNYCYYCGNGVSATKVTVIDVTDIDNLKVLSESYYPGYLDDVRRIGSSIRMIIGDYFNWPEGINYWPAYDANNPNQYNDKSALKAALEVLKVQNELIIREKTLDFWLKKGKRRAADGTLVDISYNCSDFTQMNAPTKMSGLLNIITINLDKLDADQPGNRITLLGDVGTVYASATNLYVAEWHWWWWGWTAGQSDAAYIHKFDITDPDKAVYKASGTLDGHVLDQFSLDEFNGNLRVAHTIQTWKDDPTSDDYWVGTYEVNNRVSVYAEQNGQLNVIGKTDPISPGENLYSSRFVGARGFIVTYLQTDPLYTVDLSNPTAPKVVGQLQVPGFSTYIQPIDDTHLLTIGVYQPTPTASDPETWQQRRQQLAIFDVSDFANPKQTFTITSGTAYGWSDANWEHKAFNWFPERGLLAIPFSDYSTTQCTDTDYGDACWSGYWNSFVSEVRVFSVDVNKGFTFKGAVSMADVYESYNYDGWFDYYSPWIRRSVMSTDADGKDFVYAVSDAGIRVANLGDLTTLKTVEFGPTTGQPGL